ncbi:serine protease family S33 [Achlya hypogyna]|uniref:Serine protease family S33 n=1 Tax=Achlya hypogyna TaxID=1202772 RepID=A0A1V9YNF3_ACHHY|nr:serine protease family S33 [Achlya hypogyna]
MRRIVAVLALLLQAVWAIDVDGWYNCSAATFASVNARRNAKNRTVECALVVLPLCHDTICTDPRNRTIQVFLKRILASSVATRDLWVLQGGPGASSIAMETMMVDVFDVLGGDVNVYTMDHRGTGRSTPLQCIANQAATSGSPGGIAIELAEMPACISDVLFQMGGHTSAFSVTSAARDLEMLIRVFSGSSQETYVYGASYGTLLVERLMQLAPPRVTGYILDGVISQEGSDLYRHSFANWDYDLARVGDRFLARCASDPYCHAKVPYNLTTLVHELFARVDALPTSTVPPSHKLRTVFGKMLLNWELRQLLPALVYRLWRSGADDVAALTTFKSASMLWQAAAGEPDGFSMMLYYLIVFSEEWQYPAPTIADLTQQFESGAFGTDVTGLMPYYCLATQYADAACTDVVPQYDSPKYVYQRDMYWNSSAIIPDQASVLLFTGEFDAQTEARYAQREMRSLVGTAKRMIVFPDATHCACFSTPMLTGDVACGVWVLASYLEQHGNLSAIDTSCKNDMRRISFAVAPSTALKYFGTTDAYGNAEASLIALKEHPLPMQTTGAALDAMSYVLLYSVLLVGGLLLRRKRTRDTTSDLTLVSPPAML